MAPFNQPIKLTSVNEDTQQAAPLRCSFSELATDPSRGLSRSR
jgi:hypothetical protein